MCQENKTVVAVVTLVPKGHSCEVRQEQTCEQDPLTLRVFKKNNFKPDDFGNIFQALVGLHLTR